MAKFKLGEATKAMIEVRTKLNPAIIYSVIDNKTYAVGGSDWVEVPDGTTLKDIKWVKPEGKSKPKPQGKYIEVEGSKGNTYIVKLEGNRVTCTCPGFKFRKSCKHQELLK